MKKLFSLLFLFSIVFGNTIEINKKEYSSLKKELQNLKPYQLENLRFSLEYGDQYGLGITLAAIAWQETQFGKRVINTKDGLHGSFCLYQVQAAVAAKRYNLQPETAKDILLNNIGFCGKAAVDELLFWKGRKDNTFPKMLARYNAGYKGLSNPNGKRYSDSVRKRILVLKDFLKERKLF